MWGFGMGVELSGSPGYIPDPSSRCERWCAHCACSQRAVEKAPCWQCGGTTQSHKPAWWPPSGTSQSVLGGQSWDPSDEEGDPE